MTYQIIITEEVANVAVTSESYPIIIEYNATNISANATYGNTEVQAYLASGNITSNVIFNSSLATTGLIVASGNVSGSNVVTTGYVTATGNVQGGNIRTAGQVSAAGNVQGAYILGDGSQLTGLPVQPGTYGNANVAANLAAFGSNPISTSGNVTAGYVVGNGSLLTNITGGNVTGTVANATYALTSNAASFATTASTAATVTDAAQGNITSVGTLTSLSVSGNITGANVIAPNFQATNSAGGTLKNASGTTQASWGAGGGDNFAVSVSTNINGTNAQVDISPTGTGHVHIKPTGTGSIEVAPTNVGSINNMVIGNVTPLAVSATTVSASGNVTGGNIATAGLITATGNITGANIVATANLTSTQQTVVGTANITNGTGNIVVSGKNIATDMAFVPDGGNAVNAALSRIVVGTGWLGNITHSTQQQRLVVSDSFNRTNNATVVRPLASDPIITLTANVTNTGFRQQGAGVQMRIGGGAAANTVALGQAFGAPFSMAAGQFNIDIGNATPYFLGNTSLGHATMNSGVLTLNGGSNIGNAYAFVGSVAGQGSGTANITNYLGYSSTFSGANVTGNLFCFYNGNITGSLGAYAIQTANTARAATNYYFLRNDDDVAQNKLGSLRTYHEFESATATSGSFAIDKSTAQVHNIVPTGNCTITGYSNMVTSASDSVNTDAQVDTLTIIVEQGATPYTVTLPTGSTYKYAGNISTVGATANAVTMISVTAANVRGTVTYLTTVSPEFV